MKNVLLSSFLLLFFLSACSQQEGTTGEETISTATAGEQPISPAVVEVLNQYSLQDTVVKSEAEWRQQLSAAEFEVLRAEGTEPPFKNEFNDNKREGIYSCAACGNPMFTSATKFESGTGWPSFWAPIALNRVKEVQDLALGMVRTEVECARCGSHIGHVFPDGPEPTGLRYCLNSIALDFKETELD